MTTAGSRFFDHLKDREQARSYIFFQLITGKVAAGSTRQYFTFYIIGGAVYLILTGLSGRLFHMAEARVRRTRQRSPV